MAKNKKKGGGVVLWSVLTGVSAVAFGAACVGTNLANASAQAVNIALKTSTNKTVGKDDSVKYFETGFDSVEDLEAHDKEIAEQLTGEGAVLLKNNGALPLAAGSKISTLSHSSVGIATCGTGSADIDTSKAPTLKEALEADGLEVNPTLWDFYLTGEGSKFPRNPSKDTDATGINVRSDYHVNEVPMDVYTDAVKDSFASYGDAAIITITRLAGEMYDVPIDGFTDGTDALQLTQEEKDLLAMARENFDKVIVLINSTNAMQCDFLTDDSYGVDAALWIGYTGTWGLNAVADILTGEVNPSGHSADTFVYDLTAAPYFNNIGAFAYTNADSVGYTAAGLFGRDPEQVPPHFVNYVEGIYVGYKFYETAAAEGLIDYDKTVQYPFGHGLSYTTFTQKIDSMTEADGTITLDVTVTNTGSVAGKDAVQVYFNPPYTDGGIEKASANLVTFGKTDSIEPGASQTLTLTFNTEDMASFDSKDKGCYVLEEGDYIISINEDSHTVLDSKTYNVASTIVYDESNPRSTDAEAATTKFDFADDKLVTLSRADHFANYAEAVAAPSDYTMSEESMNTLYNDHNWTPEDFNDPNDEMPVTGANNGLKLADLRGADYDDERWDTLLDQMTVTEMDDLIALGGYQTKAEASVDKYATIDCDGPAAINNNFTGVSSIGFPSEIIIASTFNTDLARRYGESIGRMASEMNVTGWYAPAMNGHRSAFDGRNFEYYSEDSVLAGYIGASSIAGAQSYGVYAYMKHFALNDQQINQSKLLCTWADEQAIREIYLRPFEISAKVGGCKAVMSSWNYIGNQWAGACNALLNGVLRGEWGFRGMVITDGFHFTDYMDSDIAIRNGCDLMLKNYDVATNHLTDTTSATSVKAMRQACKNIMYTVVNSRVYDPANTVSTPIWRTAMIVVNVLLAVLLVVLEVLTFKSYKKKKAQ